MSFMKNIAQLGASFIPGVGPLAGAAIGAIGSGGKQAGQTQNYTQNQTQNIDQTQNVDQFNEAIENPAFAGLREGLGSMFKQELNRANNPVYGDAQKAKHLSDLNDLASSSISSIKANLGARGGLDSGAFSEAVSGVERDRMGKATDFFSQLPFLEEQQRQQRVGGLLGMGMNWVGRAPISQKTTGTNTTKGTNTSTGTTNGTMTQNGPGFLGAFTNNLGGLMGANAGRPGTVPTLGANINYGNGPGSWGDY